MNRVRFFQKLHLTGLMRCGILIAGKFFSKGDLTELVRCDIILAV